MIYMIPPCKAKSGNSLLVKQAVSASWLITQYSPVLKALPYRVRPGTRIRSLDTEQCQWYVLTLSISVPRDGITFITCRPLHWD